MNHTIHLIYRPRRARPPTGHTAATDTLMASLAVLATARSGSSSSTGSSGSSNGGGLATSQLLACFHCMRSQSMPNWPDFTIDSGVRPVFGVTKAGIDRQFIQSSRFRPPKSECQRLTGGAPIARA